MLGTIYYFFTDYWYLIVAVLGGLFLFAYIKNTLSTVLKATGIGALIFTADQVFSGIFVFFQQPASNTGWSGIEPLINVPAFALMGALVGAIVGTIAGLVKPYKAPSLWSFIGEAILGALVGVLFIFGACDKVSPYVATLFGDGQFILIYAAILALLAGMLFGVVCGALAGKMAMMSKWRYADIAVLIGGILGGLIFPVFMLYRDVGRLHYWCMDYMPS